MSPRLSLQADELSDEGPFRSLNEDVVLVREDLGLFVLADGTGGKGRGDVAATLAVRTVENYIGATVREAHEAPTFDRWGNPYPARRLSRALHRAHGHLLEALRQQPERAGMASTILAALFTPRTGQLHLAHVGNSRAYRLRQGQLEALTEDHSWARAVLEKNPELDDQNAPSLSRSTVVRALGLAGPFQVSVRSIPLLPGDRFLLCSDGLSSFVAPAQLQQILSEPEPLSFLSSELLAAAITANSRDNISLIVLEATEPEFSDELPTSPYLDPLLSSPTWELPEGTAVHTEHSLSADEHPVAEASRALAEPLPLLPLPPQPSYYQVDEGDIELLPDSSTVTDFPDLPATDNPPPSSR